MQIVEVLAAFDTGVGLHPRRRIVLLLRDDGLFTFAEQYYYESKHDGAVIASGWQSLEPDGIYADMAGVRAAAWAELDRLKR